MKQTTIYVSPVGESVDKHINLVKLCVGAEKVEDLLDWQKSGRADGPDGLPRHITRMWPKHAVELTDGGSLYWVIKGLILARQRILRLDEVLGGDGISRCALVLERKVYRTESAMQSPSDSTPVRTSVVRSSPLHP